MKNKTFHWVQCVCLVALLALQSFSTHAAVIKTELAGNSLAEYPFFEYVKAINKNATVKVAIDPTRFTTIVGQTCDIYIVAAKNNIEWRGDSSLIDITTGGIQTETFLGTTIQNNTFQITAALELNADAGIGLGVGYDVVFDCDQNGSLSDGDYIDGLSDEAGFYAVHDTTAAGPLAVTEVSYNLDPGIGIQFSIPLDHLAEKVFYPSDVASMGQLPIIICSHGTGGNFNDYDHLGPHMASYGYIVMSHSNNTTPGVEAAAMTTLGHTDAFIDQVESGAIAGGNLAGHIDSNRITWIGHSRGAEGVVISYDRLFDGSHTPTHFDKADIKLISSMLPTDFAGTDISNPHDANYHLWTASGDIDVNGHAGGWCTDFGSSDPRELCQTFHLHERATGYRQSTVVQGSGHLYFIEGPEWGDEVEGPCSIGPTNDLTHLIELGHFVPLIKYYIEGNIPAFDFLTRQYESFRPIGVPTGNPCIVVSHEFRNGSTIGNFIIDDYQTQNNNGISSSGGQVVFDVENLTEGRMDDNNSTFVWMASDPFNGATQGGATDDLTIRNDSTRGVVFDWTAEDRFYEWEIIPGRRNFSDNTYLSFRGAQGSRHPNTIAELGDLTFSVTLRDIDGTNSSISIGAFGGGLEQPYDRYGGWHNEMETIRIRITDFLNNGSGLNLNDIVAIRLDMGPSWGSDRGRIVVDDLVLTNDYSPFEPRKPMLRISDITLNYQEVELGFASTKALVLHNDGNADLNVSVSLTTLPGDPMFDQWSEINGTSTVTVRPGDPPVILEQVYEPYSLGTHTILMEVTSNDPVKPSQLITLTGSGINRIPIYSVLMLDRSGSMRDQAGDRIKVETLRDAAMLYSDFLRNDSSGNADKPGFWKYNNIYTKYMPLTVITRVKKDSIEVTELGLDALNDIAKLRPYSSPGIGGAMQNDATALGITN